MAIVLNTVTVRHERRIRLGFTVPLAAGAFTSTAFYTVTCLDGATVSPGVKKALVVLASPAFVELQLTVDLAQGALYQVSAVGVPGTDFTTAPNPSTAAFRVAEEVRPALGPGAAGALSDLEIQLYGLDLGMTEAGDFAEGPSGDLATAGGVTLVELDLTNRLLANGLPWDSAFGPHLRGYVDGAPGALLPVRARVIRELRQDDRVATADATVDISDPEAPTITATPTLVGAALVGARRVLSLNAPLT